MVIEISDYLTAPHWSSDILLDTPHYRVEALSETGYAVLNDLEPSIPEEEFMDLEYMDWKSGGDTNFAPIATADGNLDCRGFWKPGVERPDKAGKWTSNAEGCPSLVAHVKSVGADFGRVRVIRLAPQSYEEALRQIHRDDNNRFNPDGDGWVVRQWIELTDNPGAFMILMEQGTDGLPDPSTEVHIPFHRNARVMVDTQRLWHVVCNPSSTMRYALITSLESSPPLARWIAANQP